MKRAPLALVALGGATLAGCGAHKTEATGAPECKVVPLHSQFWTTMPFNMAGCSPG